MLCIFFLPKIKVHTTFAIIKNLGITDNALATGHVSQPIGLLVQIKRSQCQALAHILGPCTQGQRLSHWIQLLEVLPY
jgi:hypothetical protein